MALAVICTTILLIVHPAMLMDMKKTSDKYGPFKIGKVESELCHGPKLLDQAVVSAANFRHENDVILATFSYNVTEAAKMNEIKITVYNMKDNKKSIMWNYKLTEPCKHFAVSAALTQNLHMKPDSCIAKVGVYNFDVNVSDAVHKFYGDSFFYGDYMFKLVSLSKNGNLGCMVMRQVFEKKD
ncbi:uncharacterized protein LOC128674365 [Plodia interpunctella]|uniref:uncharacterized protein LOC128674365 n=1 Tax=Plodia interpunctella TaxID=58824 RepID=UPI002367E1D9|nr:uncharacterized protein LOC128674365 [Plodia interpunctella]